MVRSQSNGGKENMSSIEVACINEIIIDIHILTKTFLCIHQDDIKGCYELIIRQHAIFNSRPFNILDNVGWFHSYTHNYLQFQNQLYTFLSIWIYTNTDKFQLHGVKKWRDSQRTNSRLQHLFTTKKTNVDNTYVRGCGW